jgi:hypothetical protein
MHRRARKVDQKSGEIYETCAIDTRFDVRSGVTKTNLLPRNRLFTLRLVTFLVLAKAKDRDDLGRLSFTAAVRGSRSNLSIERSKASSGRAWHPALDSIKTRVSPDRR